MFSLFTNTMPSLQLFRKDGKVLSDLRTRAGGGGGGGR